MKIHILFPKSFFMIFHYNSLNPIHQPSAKTFIIVLMIGFILFPTRSMASNEVLDFNPKDSNDTISDYFMHQKNYIPGKPLNQVVKTIYVAINIWQKDDGSGNFTENDFVAERMEYLINVINDYFFVKSHPPSHPIEGVEYLEDSNIRFVLKEVNYIQDSSMYGVDCGAGAKLNEYVFKKWPHKRKYLNIHFNSGSCIGATGYANYPSGRDLETDGYIVTFIRIDPESGEQGHPYWALMQHLAHEIGHNLELRHPYDSEFCRFSHPDFLFDLFGNERQQWCRNPRSNCDVCYHQGDWSCDINNPQNTCTNNFMGGSQSMGNITPLQMGRMNRALAIRSVRKYAWGYSDQPYFVDSDQHWAFNIKYYQDIRVKAGTTLHITGTLEMVPQARIILEPGAKLIVDGGKITNALYSESSWQGVVKEISPKKKFAFLRKKDAPAEVILLNDGKIENFISQ
jgi:hypothetical protein